MGLEKRRLGQSDMEITRVGIGTAPIGSTPEWRIYWGPQDEKIAIKTIQTAIDQGINWIDTAPFYGWGRAEKIVGEAIKGRRDGVFIFTKCGTLPDGKGGWVENLKPASMRKELEESLRRLGTDHVDLYQFHDPDPSTPVEESWLEMQKLIDEGKVRYGGLSNHPIRLMQRAMKLGPVTSTQNQYNPLERSAENDLLPFCHRFGIGFLAWSPLASGFLADGFDLRGLDKKDFRRAHTYAQPENYSNIMRIREESGRVAKARGRMLAELVITWELMQQGLTAAIMGVRNEREARQMADGLDWRLTNAEMKTVEKSLRHWSSAARVVADPA